MIVASGALNRCNSMLLLLVLFVRAVLRFDGMRLIFLLFVSLRNLRALVAKSKHQVYQYELYSSSIHHIKTHKLADNGEDDVDTSAMHPRQNYARKRICIRKFPVPQRFLRITRSY